MAAARLSAWSGRRSIEPLLTKYPIPPGTSSRGEKPRRQGHVLALPGWALAQTGAISREYTLFRREDAEARRSGAVLNPAGALRFRKSGNFLPP